MIADIVLLHCAHREGEEVKGEEEVKDVDRNLILDFEHCVVPQGNGLQDYNGRKETTNNQLNEPHLHTPHT